MSPAFPLPVRGPPEAPFFVRRYRIVVGTDLTEYAEIVIEHALDQAARHAAPELHFVHVAERRHRALEEIKQRMTAIVHPCLQTFTAHDTDWRARLHIRRGRPDEQIAMLAADVRADLIVMGKFGLHHPRQQPRKSLPGRLLQIAPCATLIVGMPPVLDTGPRCPACSALREHTEGDRWFCEAHVATRHGTASSPMRVWSRGQLLRHETARPK